MPLVSEIGIVGVIDIATESRLPPEAAEIAEPLVRALACHIDELREGRAIDLSSLVRLFVHMSSLRDPTTIATVATRALGRVLPIEASQLLLAEESGDLVEQAHWCVAEGGPEPLPPGALHALRARVDSSAVFELLDTSMMRVPELVGTGARSVVLLPLRANGAELGYLVGTSRFQKQFDRGQSELAALLAAHAAASLDSAIALVRERRSAHTDALTGLLNRRGLEQLLDGELEVAQSERRALSLVLLDCDDFKDVNDRAGHEHGDAVLHELGRVLEKSCPPDGAAARLGGDEFVVMLPGVDADGAFEIAERVRGEIDRGLDDAGFPLHVSAGLSTYPYDGAGATQLIRAADQALYRAKASGKNRVVGFRAVAVTSGPADTAPPGRAARRRAGSDRSALGDAVESVAAIWAEESLDDVLARLSKAVTFVAGATGALVSRIEGPQLLDAVRHAMRDVDLGEDTAYLISDFPVTKEILDTQTIKSISFLDDDLDRAEAFVLRELRMNCAMLVPLVVRGRSWGLVEIYDMRLRRFTQDDEALAGLLVGQAGRRIEALDDATPSKRRLPLFRLPSA